MDPTQVRLPCSMPEAVCISGPPRRFSSHRARSIDAWLSPWRVLRWLLLDADDAIVRWRRNERAVDRPARVGHPSGKSRTYLKIV
jgi:hypothetical protein